MDIKTVCVIGLGYIGLPTAATLASRGLKVIGVDINKHAVDTINSGNVHIVEPDLDVVVRSVVETGMLRATMRPERADAFIIAVPTPFKNDHQPDLSYVEAATRAIAPVLKEGDLVVLESTSPVGTTELMCEWLAESRKDLLFPHEHGENSTINVAYCPERVLPGKVLQELINNDRSIGGISMKCAVRAVSLYKTFVAGDCIVTNARTAEMCKLTENAFRDVNIAFANELSLICESLGINVWELIQLANHHPRVNILQPSAGVGGHCIAVDPWFIVSSAPEQSRLIHSARLVNDSKPQFVVKKVLEQVRRANARDVVLLGLAFKPDIDDLRESPALHIVQELAAKEEFNCLIVEPYIDSLPNSLSNRPNVKLVTLERALDSCDAIAVALVAHSIFKKNSKLIDDTFCNMLDFVNLKN